MTLRAITRLIRRNKQLLFDHLVGGGEEPARNFETERVSRLMLMTNSNFALWITGKSDGFSPWSMRDEQRDELAPSHCLPLKAEDRALKDTLFSTRRPVG
jgi:hypothetical protein